MRLPDEVASATEVEYLTAKRRKRALDNGRALRRWSLGLLGAGFACLVAFRIIGSEVDADGVLREPFPLVPIGWFSISVGLILGGLYVFGRLSAGNRGTPPDAN